MGRKKGSLNKKTILSNEACKKLENITETGGQSQSSGPVLRTEVDDLKQQIKNFQKIIEGFNQQLEKKQDPSYKDKAVPFNVKDCDKHSFLTTEQVQKYQEQKVDAIRELEGHRKKLASILGGNVTIFEDQTGDATELWKRRTKAENALAELSPPKIQQSDLPKVQIEYDKLTTELKKLMPSNSASWAVGTPEYAEAMRMALIIQTKYGAKIQRWQNLGKLIDPENSSLWNLETLSRD